MRTREFDKEEVLRTVMSVFWRQGYVATSIDDLARATGVSRSGLYGEFKSKKGLFLAASDLYERTVVDNIIGRIEAGDLGLPAIRQAFETVCSAAESKQRLGCLICNASSEVAGQDSDIGAVVSDYQERVRAAFLSCLKSARRRGPSAQNADIEAQADFLLGAFQGLAHAVRSPMSPHAIRQYVEGVLEAVERAGSPGRRG